jgi:hypothetical protein
MEQIGLDLVYLGLGYAVDGILFVGQEPFAMDVGPFDLGADRKSVV